MGDTLPSGQPPKGSADWKLERTGRSLRGCPAPPYWYSCAEGAKGLYCDAEPAAASVPAEAGPSMPTAPAGREIPVQAPSQTEPGAGGAPSAPAAADQAAKARAEAPKEATAGDATAPGAAAPEEATHHPAGSPSKQ